MGYTYTKAVRRCLFEIQIQLDVLYLYLPKSGNPLLPSIFAPLPHPDLPKSIFLLGLDRDF